MASKLRLVYDSKKELHGAIFFCPGCECPHFITVNGHKNVVGKTWKYSGNAESPTIDPEILSSPNDKENRCHCKIDDGAIRFMPDSGHHLKGQVVPMLEAEGLV